MTYFQSAVLGIIQGLTEFLPVSSSGHLILVPRLLGWQDEGLAFDAAIHLGTLAALLVYFRRDLVEMALGTDRRLAVLLAAATVPAGLAGLLLGKAIETRLRSPMVVAVSLIVWALVMWIADRQASRRRQLTQAPAHVRWLAGMAVGVAQAVALIPGTSRSGITITAGLFAGMSRVTSARFAFLLSIPITAAAGGYSALKLLGHGLDPALLGPLGMGVLTSFLAGLPAGGVLVHFLPPRSLLPFVIYRCALGVVIMWMFR